MRDTRSMAGNAKRLADTVSVIPMHLGFTNVDRTVHISHKAIDPPGQAWSDLKIFAEYSHRMGFKDKDGQPLIKWHDEPEKAFNHWKSCTAVSARSQSWESDTQ